MSDLVNLPVKDIILSEKNPRKISREQMQKLCKSLEDDPAFLDLRPVLIHEVDGKYYAYAGNQRVTAAKKLKWKTIPCIVSKDLSENTINTRMIKDNKSFGDFDKDMLLEGFDLGALLDCGFTQEELPFPDEPKMDFNDKEKKPTVCPSCGFEF